MATAEHFLDRYLDPIAEALTPQVAQRILDLRPAPDVLERVAHLAEKSNDGTLTEAERDEYQALARRRHPYCPFQSQGPPHSLSTFNLSAMNVTVRDFVRARADKRCEYCRLPDAADEWPFHVDHIVARADGGDDELTNLSWSCTQCNLHKGSNIASIDPQTGERVDLYNPRLHDWAENFELKPDGWITGLSPTGRATARLLA